MTLSATAPPRHEMIRVSGVRVHNLKNIDVEIPRGRLTWLTGVSGSGKSSLAFDTLYAEGQRRFIAGFSTHARQFLERLDRPDADEIDNLPPAIALRQQAGGARSGATVALATELNHYLRLLFARVSEYHDPETGQPIRKDSPESAAEWIRTLPEGRRYLIAFSLPEASSSRDRVIDALLERGLTRAIVAGRTVRLDRERKTMADEWPSHVIVDRLATNRDSSRRVIESLETAFQEGNGQCALLFESDPPDNLGLWSPLELDDAPWSERVFRRRLMDRQSGEELPDPTPALFSFQSPLGACPACQGRGQLSDNSSEDKEVCPACGGKRLNRVALSVRVAGLDIADWQRLTIAEAFSRFEAFDERSSADTIARTLLPGIVGRLGTLMELGLGYLELDRRLETLSTGESRRVALTAAIGSNLVNMLYVLDEPTAGLHPRDRRQMLRVLKGLRDAPNTVIVIDHDPSFREAVDWVIELGPGAGREGGQLVFAGPPEEFRGGVESPEITPRDTDRNHGPVCLEPSEPAIVLSGCRRHNLRDLSVVFPLNQLVAVTGVSGSGKSTLIAETFYPAMRHALGQTEDRADAAVAGFESIEDVVLVDQSAVGRSIRSNAATFLNAFDAIRQAFAATPEAKLRDLKPGAFSFNSASGGRCPHCRGAGMITIDMQFLPDIEVTCPECHGARFRPDILEVKLRGRSIAEVLDMTASEAFSYFRGHNKVLRRLAPLKEVGLGYLPLGQATSTFSGGEIGRLKIASFLAERASKRTLFLFDEPTVGLHSSDVVTLLECFRRLIAVGHSIVAIEHRPQFVREADWLIDLGPEAGAAGGTIVAAGPPGHVAGVAESRTGRYLLSHDR